MKVETYICDICKEEIPKIKKKYAPGIEKEFYRFGSLDYETGKQINAHEFGLDLCEKCAGEINLKMLKYKYEILNSCK